MKIMATIKVEIYKANLVVKIVIKQTNMEVQKSGKQIFTTLQWFIPKSQAENTQKHYTDPTSPQQSPITQESPIDLNQPTKIDINTKFNFPTSTNTKSIPVTLK